MTHITIEKAKLERIVTKLAQLHGHRIESVAHTIDVTEEVACCAEVLAQPAPTVQEPIYQMQMMDGKWIDQAKQSYEYNKAHGHTVRIVYTTPPAQPAPKKGTTP
jgi:hypothetical protein